MFDELKLDIVYRVEGNSVAKYQVIGETHNNKILIPCGVEIMVSKNQLYKKKEDAQYRLFVKRMKDGAILKNYKSSKYYSMYVERCSTEYPEWLI